MQPLGIKVMVLWSISEIPITLSFSLQWLFFSSLFLQYFYVIISFNFPTSCQVYLDTNTFLQEEDPSFLWGTNFIRLEQISSYFSKSHMTSAQPVMETFPPVCIIHTKAHDPGQVNQSSLKLCIFFFLFLHLLLIWKDISQGVYCPPCRTRFVSHMTSVLTIQLCNCSRRVVIDKM